MVIFSVNDIQVQQIKRMAAEELYRTHIKQIYKRTYHSVMPTLPNKKPKKWLIQVFA